MRFARFSSIPYAPTAECPDGVHNLFAQKLTKIHTPILDNAHHCTPKSVAVELLDEEDEYESLPATASVLVQGAAGSIAGVVEHTCFFPVDGESHTAYRIPHTFPPLPIPSRDGYDPTYRSRCAHLPHAVSSGAHRCGRGAESNNRITTCIPFHFDVLPSACLPARAPQRGVRSQAIAIGCQLCEICLTLASHSPLISLASPRTAIPPFSSSRSSPTTNCSGENEAAQNTTGTRNTVHRGHTRAEDNSC